jgi:hypothetical protein
MKSQDQAESTLIQETPSFAPECTHYWVIDTPSGPVSNGVCKACGEVREFRNYLENSPPWEDDVPLDQVSSGARFRTGEPSAETANQSDE